MVKRILIPAVLILAVVLVFWGRLIFPVPKLVYTVEIIGSDIWNVYYPGREFLSESLKRGEIPFWNKDIGMGFPAFAEGQVGAFYLPNLVLFWLLPTWLAWNVNILLVFFLAFWGSYLFFKRQGMSGAAGFFAGFSFSFGGYFVARIIHFAPLQVISLMPWVFWAGDRLWEKPARWRVLVFSFILAQQIYAGHMQWVFITLIGYFILICIKYLESQKDVGKKTIAVLLSLFFALALAAPQLLETWQLRSVSERSQGLSASEVNVFSYDPRNLINFIFPEYYGAPRNGTYQGDAKLGLYWENIAYIGILPWLFFIFWIVGRKKKVWEWGMLMMGVFSLLLALGQSSPFYFLMSLPIFNNFRVSSRFLLLTTFAVCGLAGMGFEEMVGFFGKNISDKKRTVISLVIIFIAVFDVYKFAGKYHSLVAVERALKSPGTTDVVQEGERIYTDLNYLRYWQESYVKSGWQEPEMFLYLKNSLYGNLSFIFDRNNLRVLAGLGTERGGVFESVHEEMLDASGVKYVISTGSERSEEELEFIDKVEPDSKEYPAIYIYENKDKLERDRLVSSYIVRSDFKEAAEVVKAGNFPFGETVILEEEIGENFEDLSTAEAEVVEEGNLRKVVKVKADKKAILVMADSYYPAWKARVNGEEVKIMPANIDQRAVIVPEGESMVELWYEPREFKRGVLIAVVSVGVFVVYCIFLFAVSSKKRK